MKKKKRDFLSMSDFSQKEIWEVLVLAQKMKKRSFSNVLKNRSIGLIFQKPSTRTSVSFAVGIHQLGGHPLLLNADILQLKRGEAPKDTGRVLSRYLDAVVIRANRHDDIMEMAGFATVPVINGLTEKEHPCQVMADLLTIMEKTGKKHPKHLKGFKVTFLGDANNVLNSWMLAAAILEMNLQVACPPQYQPAQEFRLMVDTFSPKRKADIKFITDPKVAVKGAQAVYTDVWASMGQEKESQKRKMAFSAYQLNAEILKEASPNALVMHCLPAHRGEEITEEILEGPQSVVFDQAENRLHVQKAVLATFLS
jgi:ornithine carbamoyltransferase